MTSTNIFLRIQLANVVFIQRISFVRRILKLRKCTIVFQKIVFIEQTLNRILVCLKITNQHFQFQVLGKSSPLINISFQKHIIRFYIRAGFFCCLRTLCNRFIQNSQNTRIHHRTSIIIMRIRIVHLVQGLRERNILIQIGQHVIIIRCKHFGNHPIIPCFVLFRHGNHILQVGQCIGIRIGKETVIRSYRQTVITQSIILVGCISLGGKLKPHIPYQIAIKSQLCDGRSTCRRKQCRHGSRYRIVRIVIDIKIILTGCQ